MICTSFLSALGARVWAVVSRNVTKVVSTSSISSFPASDLEKSKMSLMMVSSDWPESLMVCNISCCSASSLVRLSSSIMPTTPFIGVLISWLILARNSLLACAATSASSFASCNSAISSSSLSWRMMAFCALKRVSVSGGLAGGKCLKAYKL